MRAGAERGRVGGGAGHEQALAALPGCDGLAARSLVAAGRAGTHQRRGVNGRRQSPAGTGIAFSPGDREMLDFLADSHPFFLQMGAYFLFDAYRYNYRRGDKVDYRWVQDRMRDNAVEHFLPLRLVLSIPLSQSAPGAGGA